MRDLVNTAPDWFAELLGSVWRGYGRRDPDADQIDDYWRWVRSLPPEAVKRGVAAACRESRTRVPTALEIEQCVKSAARRARAPQPPSTRALPARAPTKNAVFEHLAQVWEAEDRQPGAPADPVWDPVTRSWRITPEMQDLNAKRAKELSEAMAEAFGAGL